jgi:hypothetical protein
LITFSPGALFAQDDLATGDSATGEGGTGEGSLWAFEPIAATIGPLVGPTAIDQRIAERLPAGLSPAPLADRRTLIRRATFDLTGLPPTPDQIDAYLNDPATDDQAFAKLVDRLLASPQYGERMAQHWLDVVRYADSSGLANDYQRGSAWRYRDYVVRAFNSDLPFDRFVIEQIAGDEERPDDSQSLIAVGFLRMGPWELTGMEVPKVARQRFLDDVTNIIGEAFLGQSLQCARCHDHKFDPIPTADYYAVQAALATTQLAEREADFLPNETRHGFDERQYLLQRQAEHQETLDRLDRQLLENAREWFVATGRDPSVWEAVVAEVAARSGKGGSNGVFAQGRSVLLKRGVPEEEFPPKLVGFTPAEYGLERVARKGLERLRWELDRFEPIALSVYAGRTPKLTSVNAPLRVPADPEGTGELEPTCVLNNGDPFSPGEPVRPGVLGAIGTHVPAAIPETIGGRRLALARWIADPRNPLTPRVIANRIWQWHFGRALAGNPNNFGSSGKPPTHPELLDQLAVTLIDNGWSIKSLHRLIMNSATYRRGTKHPDHEKFARLDPSGHSHAAFRSRHLTAEELRDAMLMASGELNLAIGGIPNRPEINAEAALQPRQVMGTFAEPWVPNPLPAQRHRRSIYSLKLRGLADPMLEVFNAPPADFSCEGRNESLVTPQVFALFNSQTSHRRALALAARAVRETTASESDPAQSSRRDEEAIKRCFELALGRLPTADEAKLCLDHWLDAIASGAAVKQSEQPPREVIREAVEENTGERFRFVQRLHEAEDFVPDLAPADVDPRTRALAEVCLTLLNTHEFVHVY